MPAGFVLALTRRVPAAARGVARGRLWGAVGCWLWLAAGCGWGRGCGWGVGLHHVGSVAGVVGRRQC